MTDRPTCKKCGYPKVLDGDENHMAYYCQDCDPRPVSVLTAREARLYREGGEILSENEQLKKRVVELEAELAMLIWESTLPEERGYAPESKSWMNDLWYEQYAIKGLAIDE
jgi:hypothetical protein